MAAVPGDVIRNLAWEELPASVREIPEGYDPLSEGVLMSHQVEWIDLIHAEDLCLAEKGRRTGITFATAEDDTITASTKKQYGGDNVYYIGDTKEKGLEYIGYCAHMAKVMASAMAQGWNGIEVFLFEDQQTDGTTKNITAYRIRFATGNQIVALPSTPASIRGLQGIVNIDEAAYHKNVQQVIDAATALIIWGGKIRIISTHHGVKNPFNQLIHDTRAGLYAFKIFHVTFDDAVANGLYERVCLIKGWKPTPEGKEAWYKRVRGAYGANKAAMLEELDAVPREGSGVAIPGILIENVMKEVRPILRLSLDSDFVLKGEDYRKSWCEEWIRINLKPLVESFDTEREHVFGSDYARHCDFAIFSPLSIEQDLRRKCPFMIEMHNVPTRQQEQIVWYTIDHLPRFRGGAMDATGNGQTLAEYTADRYGRHLIEEVSLNDAWYRDNMGSFQDAFVDQMIDLPRDADIKNDIRMLELINGVIKLPKIKDQDTKDSDLKRHGDSAIALALGWYRSRNDLPAVCAGSEPEKRESVTGKRPGMFAGMGGVFGRFRRKAA
jgi:phage FluMu gp28-like protein